MRFIVIITALRLVRVSLLGQESVLEEVRFSRAGGLIAEAASLDVIPPVTAGAAVRFTTDNSEPSASSPLWNGPVAIEHSAVIRARVVGSGGELGPVKSRHFVRLDSALVSDAKTGRPFTSNLPIVVIEPFGADIDNSRDSQFTYVATIRPDANGVASVQGEGDYQGRGAMHLRGETSAGFAQRSYAWETHDEAGFDKAESVLGMPAESDWVMHAPYTDKTLMRNFLVFSLMRSLRGEGSAMRTVFCEVFVNDDPNTPVGMEDYRGVYVAMEKIKRDKNRVNIAGLSPADVDPALLSGGYIFRKDKPSPDYSFSTPIGFVPLQVVEPPDINSQQAAYLEAHLGQFEEALFGGDFSNPQTGYAAFIDPLTFIDNQWFVEVTKQIDGYRLSTYFTKDRGRKIRALPLWDYNLSLGNADYLSGDNPRGWYFAEGYDYEWYPRLHEDPAYALAHWDRYWELRRGVFSKANINREILRIRDTLLNGGAARVSNTTRDSVQSPAARHFRRWPILGEYVWPNGAGYAQRKTYQSEVSTMLRFINSRISWIDRQNAVNGAILRPPVISRRGGAVPANSSVAIARYNAIPPAGMRFATGLIYVTTDGRDPRGSDGLPQGALYRGPIRIGSTQTVKARLLSGTHWSPLAQETYIIGAVPASVGNVTVSEVMYRAATPAAAEIAHGFVNGSAFDWIEIANFSDKPVDLSTLRFTEGVTFDFSTLPAASRTLPAGVAAVLVANRAAFFMRYPAVPPERVLGEFTGSLSNSGERVTLSTVSATAAAAIADFTYDDFAPWPAADGTDASLEQTAPAARNPLNDPASWRANPIVSGSPGVL